MQESETRKTPHLWSSRVLVLRFKILDYVDIGGMVNLALQIDPSPELNTTGQVFQVYGCLSKSNFPEVSFSCPILNPFKYQRKAKIIEEKTRRPPNFKRRNAA